jgi:glutamyl-tRNA synthetase
VSPLVPRGRYAPSPTGVQHLGNLRTALLAWLMARSNGGKFILRIEDLDLPRVRPGSTTGIIEDLRWLGLDFDEGPGSGGHFGPYFQSARQDLYRAAISRLRAGGLLYPCFCSRAELARIASAPQTPANGQHYPGTCLRLSAGQRRRLAAEGRAAALRFHVPDTTLTFFDEVAGRQSSSPARGGDFVVVRSDGVVSYQMAVVVDDALMSISQVVRGADLLTATFGQLALFAALGYRPPATYAHVPLLLDDTGARLAKRDLSAGLEAARAEGVTPDQILGRLAASCGLWPAGTPAQLHELLTTFNLSRLATQG